MTKKNNNNFNILFTCIGRRVSLLKSFSAAAKRLKLSSEIIGTDTTDLSSALQLCDHKYIVNFVDHPNYLNELLEIVRKHKPRLLVPTVDLDLKLLAENKEKFEKLGCFVLVSEPEIIDICQNKRETYNFLKKAGFDTPNTVRPKTALLREDLRYPCFLKPWDGYASRGTAVANNRKELEFYTKHVPNCIVQEYIEGEEFTCDAFVDLKGKVRCVVPRKRIEVRSGEVSKSQIHKLPDMMEETAKVVETLGAGPGVITIQLIKTKDGKFKFIEINPRFGGGAPLSIKAGANFPYWILKLLTNNGEDIKINSNGFKDGLTMLRYDAEVWL